MDPYAPRSAFTSDDDEKRGVEHVQFVARCVLRHWRVVGACFAVGVGATLLLIRVLPRTYRVETQLLARRQQMLPSLARPALGDESPTVGAYDAVHRRDNLVAIVRQAGLAPARPQPDRLGAGAEASEDNRLEPLVKRVDAALSVVPAEGTLAIAIEWPDPQQAYRIVEGAVQSYLESRRLTEIAPIEEAISILEGRASTMLAALVSLQGEARKQRPGRSRAAELSQSDLPLESGAAELEARLRAKQQAANEVEDYRRRKVTELRAQLTQEERLYGPDYPSLVILKQSIEALSQPSAQLASLRDEQRTLEAEYRQRFGRLPRSGGDALLGDSGELPRDEGVDALQSRLKRATLEYQTMLDRIGSARIELETARSAFKYRYSVLWPAEIPKAPHRPKIIKILVAGSLFSLLLAVATAAAIDLLSGRIVERAQVERKLGLLVLGEVRPPR